MDLIKSVTLVWIGACLRNEKDRKNTIKFFDSIGVEVANMVGNVFSKGGVKNAPVQPVEHSVESEYQ